MFSGWRFGSALVMLLLSKGELTLVTVWGIGSAAYMCKGLRGF
jgi:hypothetical protein